MPPVVNKVGVMLRHMCVRRKIKSGWTEVPKTDLILHHKKKHGCRYMEMSLCREEIHGVADVV